MKTKSKKISATIEGDWFRGAFKKGSITTSRPVATIDGGTMWLTGSTTGSTTDATILTTTTGTASFSPSTSGTWTWTTVKLDIWTDSQRAMIVDAIAEQLVHPPRRHIPVGWGLSTGGLSSTSFGKSKVYTVVDKGTLEDSVTFTYDET